MTTNSQTNNSSITTISQQEQEKKNYQNTRSDYNYNYYPAHARAREADTDLPGEEIMHRIAEAYKENIGPMITRVAAGIIERALKNGMEPETVILAIEETGMASRPSPYYLSAVLRNWTETGVTVARTRGRAQVGVTDARPWWR